MTTYIALLRGINVSGQKKIKMAELRPQMEALGFTNVQTYIQSGNIVFQHRSTKATTLEKKIKAKILEDYDFEVPVLVLTAQELDYILNHNPFAKDPQKDIKQWYVTLLAKEASAEGIAKLEAVDYRPEEYHLDGKIIYVYAANGYGRAKMNNNFFEKKLKVAATTRNWKSLNKLQEMCP